ncbi:MAG: (E)-4-hydroxy-3-methylbut-2-enyl-diphosphate synthase [Candidatus Lambdaproteobacteria bacterium]|nr:(E)-4-hydroxy-3-methylbut-2-enyl-diphosphate synthase [Candidatus Lambdaproteobacteria bacterium]
MDAFRTQLAYRRRPTRMVHVGPLTVGGDAPIRLQSMLTCNTWDVEAVLAEMRTLVDAGCELVRLTVPTQRDLAALPEIRRRMAAVGLGVPLVADIHFNPRLALGAVPYVEKVRINPGNYVDQKKFLVREYSAAQYAAELARIEEALLPLIAALKAHGRALRVGVNHGSLSDRIMNRYGDTPEGMVECAMEYLRILRRHGFEETILSMKSSNPHVVIQAYRLLVLRMEAEGMDYPLHLGVTEAGDGLDGRLKSAIGIGALLCDGLGDTVRVSLTEPSANEIPAARELVQAVQTLRDAPAWPETGFSAPIDFARRPSAALDLNGLTIGGGQPVRFLALAAAAPAGTSQPFDGLLLRPSESIPHGNGQADTAGGTAPLVPLDRAAARSAHGSAGFALLVPAAQVDGPAMARLLALPAAHERPLLPVIAGPHPLFAVRRLAALLAAHGLSWPLALLVPGEADTPPGLAPAGEIGSLAADGLLDALVCPSDDALAPIANYCQTLLQAARLRIFKTEYISCPSCGRTLFDLQETTERIKARTSHLVGLKIGVMGCIVNGPGEMADADFGYVGGAPGKVNLYQGQTCVARGVPTAQAVERLVALIKAQGRWVDPP